MKHLLAVFVQISDDPPIKRSRTFVMRLVVPAGHVVMMSVVDVNIGDIATNGACMYGYVTVYTGSNAATRIWSEHGNVCLGGHYTTPNVYTAGTDELYLYSTTYEW